MKRVMVFFPLALLAAQAWAGGPYYVDPGCSTSGTGVSDVCGRTGPKRTLSEGAELLSAQDEILYLRGTHVAHGTCPGTTGVYDVFTHGQWNIVKSGAVGHPIIIQPYRYGRVDQETVYLEGIRFTSSGWTQCSDCSSGVCAGVPGTCSDVWYYQTATCDRSQDRLYFARKPDGSITRKRPSAAQITATYDAVGWSGACNWNGDSGNTLLVRWGPTVTNPNTTKGIGVNHRRTDLLELGTSSSSTNANLTIRGLTFRNGARCAIQSQGNLTNVTITRNTFSKFIDSETGSARPVTIAVVGSGGVNNLQVTENEFSYSTSEGIHTESHPSARFTGVFARNWIHDMGDVSVLGDGMGGTPNCTTLGTASNVGSGDYSGFLVEGNLMERCTPAGRGGSGGKAILLESPVDGITVRDNVFVAVGSCFKLAIEGKNPAYHYHRNIQIYNNVCIAPGSAGGDGKCFWFSGRGDGDTSNTFTNNSIYNNTCINPVGDAFTSTESGNYAGNLFRNNLLYSSSAKKLINWTVPASAGAQNQFQHNLIYAPNAGTTVLAQVGALTFSCARILPGSDFDGSANGTADQNRCQDPLFVSAASDYHIQSNSPAKDHGTSTEMPAGRTTDINNTIAAAHRLPSYADANPIQGGIWDIGADEYARLPAPTTLGSNWSPRCGHSHTKTAKEGPLSTSSPRQKPASYSEGQSRKSASSP